MTALSSEEAEYRLLSQEIVAVVQTVSKEDLKYDSYKKNGEWVMIICIFEKKKNDLWI